MTRANAFVAGFTALLMPVAAMAASHSASGLGWFENKVINALIHALIYGVIFKAFHAMGMFPSIIFCLVGLAGAYWWYRTKGANVVAA
jgi:hypothetical protein